MTLPSEYYFVPEGSELAFMANYWRFVLDEYCARHGRQDWPWCYSERPMVGMWNAAVWMAGGVALEEYSTRKKDGKKDKYGRNDIYFVLGNRRYLAEAKHAYVDLKSAPQGWRCDALTKARSSAEELKSGKGEQPLAMAIWTFTFQKRAFDRRELEKKTLRYIQETLHAESAKDASLVVNWYFPEWQRDTTKDDEDGDRFDAGFAMEMQKVALPGSL